MALADFYIDLQGPEQAVAPGAHISAELSITNTSEHDARFKGRRYRTPTRNGCGLTAPRRWWMPDATSFVLINFKTSPSQFQRAR